MRNVRHLLTALEHKTVSWRLESKLRKMSMQTDTAEALTRLDDGADLAELLKHCGVDEHNDVQLAQRRYDHHCAKAFNEYQAEIDTSYLQSKWLPEDDQKFVFLAVRRKELDLLRGKFFHLRPVAEIILDEQQKAQRKWLQTVERAYIRYAAEVARVLCQIGVSEHVA